MLLDSFRVFHTEHRKDESHLAAVAHAQGDTQIALDCLDRALEIEPNPEFRHNRELLAAVS